MSRNEELTGVFEWEARVFQPDDPEQRTVIAQLASGETIKGRAMAGSLEYGLTYRFLGHWTQTKWGRQFHFNSFAMARPSGEQATIKYLAKGPNIGTRRAQKIWNLFGERSLEVVRTEPHRVATEIEGLTPERATEAAEYFQAHERLEKVTIEVNDLLANKGFPRTLPDKAIKEWGELAPQVIREQTWPLMRFRGVGFGRCDALYLELGRDPAGLERQGYCCWYAMAGDSEGHTWYPIDHASRALRKAVAGAKVQLREAIDWASEGGLIAERVDFQGKHWLAESKKALAEQRLAEYIRRAEIEAATTLMRWPDLAGLVRKPCMKCMKLVFGQRPTPDCEACHGSGYGLGLSIHQKNEATKALSGFIGILAGSPGTGKTYTLVEIIRAITQIQGGARIAVCAPTGKAAVRVSAGLAREGLPIVATTIHRLLGPREVKEETDGWAFEHDENNPLELDYLFVDETSMCDTTLMASLLAARPNGCHVLLIGDPDQLSPVGHGAPLRDLIAAGLPCGRLTEIQRNAGRIVRACAEIRDKQRITFSKALNLSGDEPENLLLLDRDKPDDQVAELETFLRRIEGGKKYDPVWDVQVVVPVNDKSPLARKKLNSELQKLLNPEGETVSGCPFRTGDKVVCTKNGTQPLLRGDPNGSPIAGEAYVANGEQAEIVAIADSYITMRLDLPERLIRVPRGKRQQHENEDGSEATSTGCNFDLAYAISVHKSQGSEFPIVVVMIDGYMGAVRLVDKHWLYTAVSRAKDFCLCIGPRRIAESAVRKSHMWRRKTFLCEAIEDLRLDGLKQEWLHDLVDLLETNS